MSETIRTGSCLCGDCRKETPQILADGRARHESGEGLGGSAG